MEYHSIIYSIIQIVECCECLLLSLENNLDLFWVHKVRRPYCSCSKDSIDAQDIDEAFIIHTYWM